MKRGFLLDDSAISPIIGFALVLAILVTTLGFLQQHFVPVWNAQVELDQFEKVSSDMKLFTSTVSSVAATGSPQTSTINMGLRFPSRAILYNPKPSVFGRLTTDILNVSINYTTNSGLQTIKNYTSSTIIFELDGVAQHPKLVYEHGILIKDYSAYGQPNFTAEQSISFISGSDIYIPILITNTTRKDEISITPVQKKIFQTPNSDSDPVYLAIPSKVIVTLETHYPDSWIELLPKEESTNIGVYRVNNAIIIEETITQKTQIYLPKNSSDMLMQSDTLYSGLASLKSEPGI